MKKLACGFLLAVATQLAPSDALACGGAFMPSTLQITPQQEILVAFHNGVESYTFSPVFCGVPSAFGLVLPVPNPLATDPTLLDATIFSQLDAYSAPKIQTVCSGGGIGCGGSSAGPGGGNMQGAAVGASFDAAVLASGQVGVFDWSLIQADSTAAFTDWLTANQYPYSSADDAAFSYYVGKGWYFVAFRISPNATLSSAACGPLGPINLSFPTDGPVVPARIAAVGTTAGTMDEWRMYLIGTSEWSCASCSLDFANTLSSQDLAANSAIAEVASVGDWVVRNDYSFDPTRLTGDITFSTVTPPSAYRPTNEVEGDCSGGDCATSIRTGKSCLVWGGFAVAMLTWIRRRARRGPRT